jgi:hypothetical protein
VNLFTNGNKKIYFFIFITLFSILFKLDYRYINELSCCGDDFDYYSHALTIAVDNDFDYSNQLDPSKSTYYVNGKVAPLGFYGSGLLAAPFVLVGGLFDRILVNSYMPYKIIIYSLSSIVYLFFTAYLIFKSLFLLNLKPNFTFIILSLAGSGLGFYAFERYSMTHVYEAFSVALIFYSVVKISLNQEKRFFYFLLAFSLFIALSVRYTNYHLLIAPLIFRKLFFVNNKNYLHRSGTFVSSAVFFSIIFYYINVKIYGQFILNPAEIYYADSYRVTAYLQEVNSIFKFMKINFFIFLNILFSKEFGIFWFNPAVFAGLIISLIYFKQSNVDILTKLLIAFNFIYNFGIVAVWSSTASSYGIRYLFSLIPFSLIILHKIKNTYFMGLLKKYIYIFSTFGLISILFFESTTLTELSLVPVINTYGKQDLYSNPEYLKGLIFSFIDFSAYLKIIATSLLFLIFYKLFNNFFDLTKLISDANFNVSYEQKDKFLELLQVYSNIEYLQIFFILITGISIAYLSTNLLSDES